MSIENVITHTLISAMIAPPTKWTGYACGILASGLLLCALILLESYSPLAAFLFAIFVLVACLWALVERK